jgi:hypothetical protein
MKRIAVYIFLLIPVLSFAQLFPKINDYHGKIEKVVEKYYGIEIYWFKRYTGLYFPRMYNGWKYKFIFDENSNLINQINKYKCNVRADYKFQREITKNKIIEREINQANVNNDKGNYIENEYILDTEGKFKQVNIWSFNLKDSVKKLNVIEKNTIYDNGKLVSYTSGMIDFKGDTIDFELYKIQYDIGGRLIEIGEYSNGINYKCMENDTLPTELYLDVQDTLSKLLTKYSYHYNTKGQIESYKIENLSEPCGPPERFKSLTIYFKYDKNQNWIKKYYQFDNNKKRLETKRKITYK